MVCVALRFASEAVCFCCRRWIRRDLLEERGSTSCSSVVASIDFVDRSVSSGSVAPLVGSVDLLVGCCRTCVGCCHVFENPDIPDSCCCAPLSFDWAVCILSSVRPRSELVVVEVVRPFDVGSSWRSIGRGCVTVSLVLCLRVRPSSTVRVRPSPSSSSSPSLRVRTAPSVVRVHATTSIVVVVAVLVVMMVLLRI